MVASPEPWVTKHGRMDKAEIAELTRLADEAVAADREPKVGDIARAMGRKFSTIAWQLMMRGYLDRKINYGGPRSYKRKGNTVWRWTTDEDRRIWKMRCDGLIPRVIAERMKAATGIDRPAHSVGVRLKMLAAFEWPEEQDEAA